MEARILKLTSKGQISIPVQFQELLKIKQGSQLLAIQEGDRIILQPIKESQYAALVKKSEGVIQRLWGSKEDDIWDTV